MKFFSDCSGECCLCIAAGHCLAGHGDDDYSLATKDQLIERLDLGKYRDYEDTMKCALKSWYRCDYDFIKNPTPSRILYHIVDGAVSNAKDYTYIICGKSGPTGKTWLTRTLKDFGYNAIEISESIIGLVDYNDDKNHFILNGMGKSILIVLNKPLDRK